MNIKNNLNIYTETSKAIALIAAETYGYYSMTTETWVSDAKISNLSGAIIFEEVESGSHHIITERVHHILDIEVDRRTITVSVYSESQKDNKEVIEQLKKQFPISETTENKVEISFWYHTNDGPRKYDRQLNCPKWIEIEDNYAPVTHNKLVELKDVKLVEGSGKLVLWQGDPGTGKTFALRAIAKEWAPWCEIHYILDPEKLLSDGQYLLSVILRDVDSETKDGKDIKYKLIVLEDAGELLTKDAKQQVGQGLSRLLNLCDGLLGQGLRIIVLITTNEPIGALNEAIKRPGRCISNITFDKFDATTAKQWLNKHSKTDRYLTINRHISLADMYALSEGRDISTNKTSVGFAD